MLSVNEVTMQLGLATPETIYRALRLQRIEGAMKGDDGRWQVPAAYVTQRKQERGR